MCEVEVGALGREASAAAPLVDCSRERERERRERERREREKREREERERRERERRERER